MRSPRILVVGDAMLDRYWEGEVGRLATEASVPVPVLRVTRRFERAGGAANVAANLAALGAAVSLVALVGDDADGERLGAHMDAAGVAFHRVRDPDWSTIVKIRCLTPAQPLLRADLESPPPPAMRQRLAERVARALPVHDMVVLSDYAKGALDDCAPLVRAAVEGGKVVLVDPKGADWSRYAGATLVKPDRVSLEAALDGDAGVLAARVTALRRLHGWRHVIVTEGDRGMTLFDDDCVAHEPAHVRHAHEVRDVTGAGDTVLAVLAWRLAEGDSVTQAMRWAGVAAGLAVQTVGNAVLAREALIEARDARGRDVGRPGPR